MVIKMRLLALLLVVAIGCCAGKSLEGPRRAIVSIRTADINGQIVLEQASVNSPVKIRGTIYGLEPGMHGMHVHEGRQLGVGCHQVGAHFNPTGKHHGGPRDPNRHVGDLGNIKSVHATPVPRADINIMSQLMSLYEDHPNSVLNRALVIHAEADDLGRGSNPESLKTGNAGEHIACGLVTPVDISDPSLAVEIDEQLHQHQQHLRTVKESQDKKTMKGWEDWTPSSHVASNLDVEGITRPDMPHDGYELKNAVPTRKVWKTGKVYEYDYSGFISTGMMGIGPKISGGSLKGRLVVEPVDEHTINIALREVQGKMFNEDVLEEFVKADPGSNARVMDKQHIEKPIQVKIVNGKIEMVALNKDEPLWTVNFKRALAAQLQLQLEGSSGVFHKEELSNYYAENAVYHAMEGCTTGECQTWYHISRIPKQQILANPQLLTVPELCEDKPVYEIVKNRDFDKCHSRPVFNYISTPGMNCDLASGASCQNQFAHVDTVRILGCKLDENNFVVQRIKAMDRLVIKPLGYETEALEGLTIQQLQLVSIKSQQQQHSVGAPSDAKQYKTLSYSYDEEHATGGARMSQPSLHQHNSPLVMEVDKDVAVKEAERLLAEIVRELEGVEYYTDPSGKFVSSKLNMLRKALSNLEYSQLSSFASRHMSESDQWSPINQVVIDALVIAGTNPSLMVIRDWIVKGRLQGEQAVQAVSMLPATVKTPTKELLSNLIDLLKSEAVSGHQQLKFAMALSVSRLVYQACVNSTQSANLFPKMVMGEFCSVRDPLVAHNLVPWLNEQLKKASDDIERIAMLAALGNIGHEVILPSVLPHISSCEPSSHYESEWYERHRRSMRDNEEPLVKKDWRKKWMTYKKKNAKDSKKDATIEDLLDKFEEQLRKEKDQQHGKSDKKESVEMKKGGRGGKKDEKEERKWDKKDEKEDRKGDKTDEKEERKWGKNKDAKKEDKAELKEAKLDKKTNMKEMNIMERHQHQKHQQHGKESSSMDDEELLMSEMDEDEQQERGYFEDVEKDEEESEEGAAWTMEGVEDKAACNILRTKAIYALSTMAVNKNDVVAKILMPIYFNKAEETEIRLAALSLLFVSNPPIAFWERVALSTWTESNDQVAHYIYTTIASLVSHKDPKRRDITQRAEAVLPMMKPMRWTSFVSSNYLKAGYEEKTRLGYLTKTVNFPGFESFIPANHYNSLYMTLGPWFSRVGDISINSKQAEKFIDKLLGKPTLRGKANKDESVHVHPELDKIHQELKIEARATGQPEIFIYLNLVDNYQRFLAITPQTIEKMVENMMRKSIERGIKGEAAVSYHKMVPLVDVFVRVPSAMGLAYSAIAQVRLFTSIKTNLRSGVDFKSMKSLSAKIEGTLQPVVSFELSSKITAEVPFTKSYPTAGVHVETVLAMPGRLSLAADMDSGKVQSSWEFLGDKVRLFRHATIPFTTIRKLGDYTPSLLLAESKPIMLREQPLKNDVAFGQQSLGLNLMLVERGDVQALKQANSYNQDLFGSLLFNLLPSTLRYRETNLVLDNSRSETKIIKTILSMTSKQGEQIKSEWMGRHQEDREMMDSKKASKKIGSRLMIDQEEEEHEKDWGMHKFQRLFQSMVDPTGYSLDLSVELAGDARSRRYGSSMAYGVGDYGLSHRGSMRMEKRLGGGGGIKSQVNEEENNFVLCVDVDAKLPKPSVVRREEMMRDDMSRTSTIKIGFGKSCTDDRKIVITSKMARSAEEIPSTVHSKWQERECAKQELFGRGVSEECLSTRRLAAILNKGVITIDYNEMPGVVRNATHKVSNMFRRWMGEHMSDNQVDVQNTANQIRIETVYYPIIGSMDLRVFKPKSNTFYHGINIHPVAEAVLPFNPRLTAFRAMYGGPGLCLVDRDSVTTYDGLTYNNSMAGCDQVITKDCSGRYKLAVLSREEQNKKIVTVYLNGEKIELNAAADKIKWNEMEQHMSDSSVIVRNADEQVLAVVRKTSDGFIELESPSHWIRVTVNANEVIILNSPIHRGRLCGLCGSQTGDKVTDLTGPKKCPLPDHLMNVAYELRQPSGCKSAQKPGEKEVLRRVQDSCAKEEESSIFGVTDSRPLMPKFQQHVLSLGIRSVGTECDLSRNRMIHRGRKRCFSIEPALKCSAGCQAAEYENVKMGFHCLPGGPLSDELKEAMAVRPLDELAGKEVSTTAVFRVPTSCAPAAFVEEPAHPSKQFHRHH